MKRTLLIVAFILLSVSGISGQTNDLSVGLSVSLHNETHNVIVFEKEESSLTHYLGYGIIAQKRLTESLGLNLGLNYVQRHYEKTVPYDHCFFKREATGLCDDNIEYIDRYGYKNIEIHTGINRYIEVRDKWELFLNVDFITSLSLQSFYHPVHPREEVMRNNEINLFAGSIEGSVGFLYNLTDNIGINAEPFIRLVHRQRKDPILMAGHKGWAGLDNFGVHLLLMYRL
jgi:hypothetical protein